MIFEGNIGVIDAMKEKKRLMDAGLPHGHIRPLLIMGSGLMKGVYGGAALSVLAEEGYEDVFTNAVGVSAGALPLVYFLSKQSQRIPELLANECTAQEFIRPWHVRNIINLDYMSSVLRGDTGKALAVSVILESKTKLYLGLAEYDTSKPVLLCPDNEMVLHDAMRATIAIPGMVTTPVFVREVRMVDGAATQPYVLDVAMEQIGATHVLVIMNQDTPSQASVSALEWLVSKTMWRHRYSAALLRASHQRHRARNTFAASAARQGAAVVWGDGSVSSFERQPDVLLKTYDKSRDWWLDLLQD